MDTRFLETFIVIADCGSIAEAARRLNLSSAALAQRLRALEADLGHSLVVRAGRTVQPTEEGLAILEHARNLVQGARDLRAIAAGSVPSGQLRLGATATSLVGHLPRIIAGLGQRHPEVEYFIEPGSSVDLYHRVIGEELDAALMIRPRFVIPKSADWLTFRKEPLVLLAPPDSEGEDTGTLLATHRFIRYDRSQWGGQIVDKYLRDNALEVREWLELDALDAIAAMVDRGLGVAIVPDWQPPWPEGLRLRKLPLARTEVRGVGVLWRTSGARLPAVRAFVAECRSLADDPAGGAVPQGEGLS